MCTNFMHWVAYFVHSCQNRHGVQKEKTWLVAKLETIQFICVLKNLTLRLGPEGPGGIVAPTVPPTPEEPIVAEEDIRTFFPESWIFRLMRAE